MEVIKYQVGFENSVIVEDKDFEESIFHNQYRHACTLMGRFIGRPIDNTLQILAFCGERGSGKTSCMQSVLDLVKHAQAYEDTAIKEADVIIEKRSEAYAFARRCGGDALVKERFEIPPMFDPSFFDKKNNIIELLVGYIYGDLRELERVKNYSIDRNQYNSVHNSLSKVKECLLTIHGVEDHSFNRYTELSVLANAVRLKDEVRSLIRGYLKLKGRTRLLIAVDDLDLNIVGAYEMCEQIRKYLSFPECIVFLSFSYSQLLKTISHSIEMELNTSVNASGMATRYLDKFISSGERIHMPVTYDLCNRQLRIIQKDGDKVKVYVRPNGEDTVKDVVVNLIFQKTRFLFYNSKGGISPIVPNNLRELFQLLGLLWGMPELPSDKSSVERRDVLELNKHDFKTYFFDYWTECLPSKYRNQAKEWVKNIPNNIMNKHLVSWLGSEFKDEFSKNYDINDDPEVSASTVSNLFNRIVSKDTFSYNVSTGDLFFLMSLLQKDTLSPDKELILFFIRSYYSMLLFEAYDVVTEGVGERYPAAVEGSGIYRIDRRFDHTNELQRLVNGGFFTYWPGEIISNIRSESTKGSDKSDAKAPMRISSRDTCLVDGRSETFRNLLSDCKKFILTYDKWEEDLTELRKAAKEEHKEGMAKLEEDFERLKTVFSLTEFLVLTLSHSIPQKQMDMFMQANTKYRENVEPFELYGYNVHKRYYVFDVLYPFYALVNPQFAYGRFDDLIFPKVGDDSKEDKEIEKPSDKGRFYSFALNHDFSLLRKMIAKAHGGKVPRGTVATKGDSWLSQLQSDALIRNSEVLMAIFENAVKQRDEERSSRERAQKLSAFYKSIGKSGLETHRVGYSPNDEPYKIDFSFLDAITELLDKINKDPQLISTFERLFWPTVNLSKDKTSSNTEGINKLHYEIPLAKGAFASWLDGFIGPFPLTASEVKGKLKDKVDWLEKVEDKDLNKFVRQKPNKTPYTLAQLTSHIMKNPYRQNQWMILWNKVRNK